MSDGGLRSLADQLTALTGAVLPIDVAPHAEYVSIDTVRHFARSTGDDNPLFCDPGYAASSVLGVAIAPPLFPIATGTPAAASRQTPVGALRSALEALRALPVEIREDRWELHRRIPLGQRLERSDTLWEAHHDPAADAIVVTTRSRYYQGDATYADRYRTRAHGPDRSSPAPREQAARYTADDLAAIDRCYRDETRRGAVTRRVDEVGVGAKVGPVVRGPLTLTDLVEYRAGAGRGPFAVEALRLGYLNRVRLPSFYDLDSNGAYDARERCHWDRAYAASLGHPDAYDYTHTRLAWLGHVLTDWIGDGGWLSRIRFELRANNYVGDTHWISGEVTAVEHHAGAGHGHVTLTMRATNQLGTVTCVADAEVLLPSRSEGSVELPLTNPCVR